MQDSKAPFQINFGTRPTTFELETIEVSIDTDVMLCDYAKAYSAELIRRNPGRYEVTNLDEAKLFDYFKGLVAIRIESLSDSCKVWRQAKQLLIPSFVQFALTQIGEVIDRDRGIRLIPKMDATYSIADMLDVSFALQAFTSDGLVLHKDAFPRGTEGDIDVMSMAIISGYIVSQRMVSDPLASYIAGFMGMKIQEEASLKMLYRVRYDDLQFVKQSLLHEQKIFV